jgi:hypothetical protein
MYGLSSMPRKTAEAIREYNQEYYAKNRETLLSTLNERYHNLDDDFYERQKIASAKWYKERNIREKRLIQRNKNKAINIMVPQELPVKKPPKKPKSSLQLKRGRIAKNLKQIEERAEIFRKKLSIENIYNAPQIENEPATDNSRSDRAIND